MSLTDQQAVEATLRDRHAFSILVERYQAPLLRYIQRLGTLDADVAKDILQETFIKVYLNLNDYNPTHPFSSWAYRIAHNETMIHFRRQKHRPVVLDPEQYTTLFESIPDELDIEKEIDVGRTSVDVGQAIAKLKPVYRDILVLRFFENKSYDEISYILEIPNGTVATNLARGKKALALELKNKYITDI